MAALSLSNNAFGDAFHIHSQDTRQRIAEWLSSFNYKLIQSDIFANRLGKSGEWLIDSVEFRQWCEAPHNSVLWCSGMPGVGKTVLASVVVNHLQNRGHGHAPVGFIYFHYKRQKDQTQTVSGVLSSLLRQIFEARAEVADIVGDLYERHEQLNRRPTDREVEDTLCASIAKCRGSYIILDALDEYLEDYSQAAIRTLLAVLLSLGGNIKLMVTSRNLDGMDRIFEDVQAKHLEIRATVEDLQRYVQDRIVAQYAFRERMKGDLALSLVEKVAETARGRVLLAKLHVDWLSSLFRATDIRAALENMSGAEGHVYAQVMERIEGQAEDRRQLARRVLSWITYSRRQLSVKELQHALAVSPGQTQLCEEDIYHVDTLTSVCAGLVVIDEESGVIGFVHYTTQQFFESVRGSRFPDAQMDIAKTCLAYLSLAALAKAPRSYSELEDLIQQYHFLDYAARNWGYHLKERNQGASEVALAFLYDSSKAALASAVPLSPSSYQFDYGTGSHICAIFGLVNELSDLLENGAKADQRTVFGDKTPLSLAAENGHESTVTLLLRCHAVDANSRDAIRRTPLSFAVKHGHESIAVLLLQRHDVDAHARDVRGETPLSIAAENGHESIVTLLLEREGVDADSKDNTNRTPLSLAAGNGHKSIVALLLRRQDVDAGSKDCSEMTPLSFAAQKGHKSIVALLLQRHDVDADALDAYGRTPLSFAAQEGHKSIVVLLLQRQDVNPDSKDGYGTTPLSLAAQHGHESIVALLLERGGVDVDRSGFGQVLSTAAANGHESIVALLLRRQDVDADSKDEYGRTPLSFAAQCGYESIVTLLLEREGVDADSKDKFNRTPLSFAAENGHTSIVTLLLHRQEIDANSKGRRDTTNPKSLPGIPLQEIDANSKSLPDIPQQEIDANSKGQRRPDTPQHRSRERVRDPHTARVAHWLKKLKL